MTVTVVNSKANLRKRIIRFFDTDIKPRNSLKEFLDDISLHVDTYIFGGAIRDIAINGVKKFYSDVDVVFELNEDISDIEPLLVNYSYTKNKFGGYRLDINGWELDLWEAKNTWAFESKAIEYKSIHSILETTITNWDQILFDWNKKKLIMSSYYLSDLQSGYLDLILTGNPNPLGQAVKILHFYTNKNAHLISKEMILKIKNILDSYSYEQLKEYELGSYKKSHISQDIYNFLKKNSELENPDLLPTRLENFNNTFNLL
jgi:hypothetical protein